MIHADASGELARHTRHKLKYRRRPKRKPFPIADRTSIHSRPEQANGKRFGDFEMDLIVDGHNHAILTIMEAMDYECLIRAVFKCGRTRRFGADADIFRGLESASVPFPGQKSVDQYKLGFKIGEVAAYLHTALYEVQEQYKDNKEFTSKIDKCLEYLYEPSLEDIDKCIEEAGVAFEEIGLYAG